MSVSLCCCDDCHRAADALVSRPGSCNLVMFHFFLHPFTFVPRRLVPELCRKSLQFFFNFFFSWKPNSAVCDIRSASGHSCETQREWGQLVAKLTVIARAHCWQTVCSLSQPRVLLWALKTFRLARWAAAFRRFGAVRMSCNLSTFICGSWSIKVECFSNLTADQCAFMDYLNWSCFALSSDREMLARLPNAA